MLVDCPQQVVIEAVLVVDELAASACANGLPPFEVRLIRPRGGLLRAEVGAVPAHPARSLGTGVLDSVATRWGLESDGVLWAELELRARSWLSRR